MSEQLTAEEARRITQRSLAGPVISKLVQVIDEAIRSAAREGKNNIQPIPVLSGKHFAFPTEAQEDALRKHYEALGYSWVECGQELANSKDPREHPWTELRW